MVDCRSICMTSYFIVILLNNKVSYEKSNVYHHSHRLYDGNGS